MRTSSKIALAVAGLLGILAGVGYLRTQDTPAPRLSVGVVEQLLTDAERAFERRSAAGVLEAATDDAVLFGYRKEQLQRIVAGAMRDMAGTSVSASWRNLEVQSDQDQGTAEFDLTVGEPLSGTQAVYFESHVTLVLRKVTTRYWHGLGSSTEWRISRASSSADLNIRD